MVSLGRERQRNRIARCLDRLGVLALESLGGFCIYTHYGHVGAIPIIINSDMAIRSCVEHCVLAWSASSHDTLHAIMLLVHHAHSKVMVEEYM